MKKIYLILLLSIFLFHLSLAQITLEVKITNLRSNSGNILLELLDTNGNKIEGKTGKIINAESLIVFENLKPAKYAIRYFHDENKNDKMDLNFFGIPKEGYGFSNNAFGTFGPKKFEKWIFLLSKNSKMELKTKN